MPETDDPPFVYSGHADVTDSAGETRSAERGVSVGYTALTAQLSAADWQTGDQPVEVQVETKTLDGEPQVAEGKVVVHALQMPATVQRPSLQPAHFPYRGYPFAAFGQGQTQETTPDQSDPKNWPLGPVVAETGFTTGTNGIAKLPFKLAAGEYRAVVESQDRFGRKVTGRLPVRVLQPTNPRLAIKIPFLLAAPKWSAQPGDDFLALWGTGYDAGRACVEIEHRNQIIRRGWTKPGQTQQPLRLAVTEALRGGCTLHVTQSWEHFVSKLEPGHKETWSLAIKNKAPGAGAEKLAAELVATLYDESLDAFAGLAWPHGFDVFRQDYSTVQAQFANLPEDLRRILGRWERDFPGVVLTHRAFPAELAWHGWGYGFGGGMAMDSLAVTTLSGAAASPSRRRAGRAGEMPEAAFAAPVPMALSADINSPGEASERGNASRSAAGATGYAHLAEARLEPGRRPAEPQ